MKLKPNKEECSHEIKFELNLNNIMNYMINK